MKGLGITDGIVIKRVLTAHAQTLPLRGRPICMGVSFDSIAFAPPRLERLLAWLAMQQAKTLIFLGDSLFRQTIALFSEELEASTAEATATERATFLEESIYRHWPAETLPLLNILRLSELERTRRFSLMQTRIAATVEADLQLKADLRQVAESYLARQKAKGRPLRASAPVFATAYLIDELAYYAILADDGWLVEAYPGTENRILRKALSFVYPALPESLSKRTFIQLAFNE